MIIDVGSHRDEDDHCKILLQAACLVRFANALRIDQSIPFIVTAIYIDNQLSASRYLVFQPDISKRGVRFNIVCEIGNHHLLPFHFTWRFFTQGPTLI
jgi:hypothetical protein